MDCLSLTRDEAAELRRAIVHVRFERFLGESLSALQLMTTADDGLLSLDGLFNMLYDAWHGSRCARSHCDVAGGCPAGYALQERPSGRTPRWESARWRAAEGESHSSFPNAPPRAYAPTRTARHSQTLCANKCALANVQVNPRHGLTWLSGSVPLASLVSASTTGRWTSCCTAARCAPPLTAFFASPAHTSALAWCSPIRLLAPTSADKECRRCSC